MNSKYYILTFLLIAFSWNVQAQSKPQVVRINTSAECQTCEKIIESKMNYVKGVLYADLDVNSKVLEVKYNPKKINLDQIRTEISHLGYDADEVPAQIEKQNSLPKCCQPGGMSSPK